MNTQKNPPCKQNYKGMENFLRRLAFNLGNTPSQTEVKIISCIPIDVSDLQQKITCLEKQLEEAKVGTQLQEPVPCPNPPQIQGQCRIQTKNPTAAYCTSFRQKTQPQKQASFYNPSIERATSPLKTQLPIEQKPTLADKNTSHEMCSTNSNATTVSLKNSVKQSQPFVISAPKLKEYHKAFFKKRNKLQNKINITPQCVYYAQTTRQPVQTQNVPNVLDDMEMKGKRGLTQSYFADVIERQYKPQHLGRFMSNISEYSSPICRDTIPVRSRQIESDACSCCSGPFHNIDHTPNDVFETISFGASNSAYYDSSLYDLVPVKEKTMKSFNTMPMKKEPKLNIEMQGPMERIVDKTYYRPFMENQYPIMCTNYESRKRKHFTNKAVAINSKAIVKQRKGINMGHQVDIKPSPSCCIELGNFYMKMINNNKPRHHKLIRNNTPQRKSQECMTNIITNTECQTISTTEGCVPKQFEEKRLDKKTETTLNQIKTILQTVLTEVKTNSQVKDIPKIVGKKDATIQNVYGASQTNLHASSFLNSITYNPYVLNPYTSSYSQHLNSNHFTASYQSPLKCVNNYPILIQPGHHMSPNYYRPCPENKPGCSKNTHNNYSNANKENAVTQRNNETENLIKEIYNSIALNLSFPTKNASNNEHETMQQKPKILSATKEYRDAKNVEVIRPASQTFMTKKLLTDVSVDASSENSKTTYNAGVSRHVSNNTEDNTTERSKTYTQQSNNFSVSTATEQISQVDDELYTDAESEASDTRSDSDVTVVPEEPVKKQKEHKSLFSKVLKIFKKDKNHKKEDLSKADVASTTDSDDYQTIYSRKIEKPMYPRVVNLPKHRTHSKVSNSKQMYRRERSPRRLPPYLEQEYRREWTEKMFRDRRERKYSSDRPMSREAEADMFRYYQHLGSKSARGEPRYYAPRERTMVANQRRDNARVEESAEGKRMAWLKKQKLGVRCEPQWKNFILEN